MDLSAFFESDLPVEEQKTEEFLAKLDEEGWRRFLSVAQRLAFRANETVVSQADISRGECPDFCVRGAGCRTYPCSCSLVVNVLALQGQGHVIHMSGQLGG